MKIQFESSFLVIFESSLFKTTTTLVIGEKYVLIVDPNWLPIEITFIQSYISQFVNGREKYILFTHSDYDHILGYGAFVGFKSIASQNFISNKNIEQTLNQIIKFDDDYYINRDYNIEYPEIQIVINDDKQRFKIGNDEYVFWQAVGHNPDGILVLNVSKNILIVGDYLSNVEFPYIYESVSGYKNTLDKIGFIIHNYNVDFLISGHGTYTSDKKEMQKRLLDSRSYISLLEKSIINKVDFDFNQLMTKYEFPIIMRKFHEDNINLVQKDHDL